MAHAPEISGAAFEECCDHIGRQNAVGGLRYKRLDHHPTLYYPLCGPSDQWHSILRQARIFVTAREIELQAGNRLPGAFKFRALDGRIEIEVDRRAVDDLRDLVVFVVVVEDICR